MTIWDDVQFDPVTAGHAIEALAAIAGDLDALTDRRVRLAEVAQQDWVGHQRTRFDTDLEQLVPASMELAARLRNAAATIEADLATARAEQRRRVDAREALRAEARLEALRRAQGAGNDAGHERRR